MIALTAYVAASPFWVVVLADERRILHPYPRWARPVLWVLAAPTVAFVLLGYPVLRRWAERP